MVDNDDIKRDSHRIWLAGLGAYTQMSKADASAFESLVEAGRLQEQQSRGASAQDPDSRIVDLKQRANETIDRIERAFDLRVSSALDRLGISKKSDMQRLSEKVDHLTRLLEQCKR